MRRGILRDYSTPILGAKINCSGLSSLQGVASGTIRIKSIRPDKVVLDLFELSNRAGDISDERYLWAGKTEESGPGRGRRIRTRQNNAAIVDTWGERTDVVELTE